MTALTSTRRRVGSPEKRRGTILTIVMWATVLYFLVPLYWLLIASTKDNTDLFSTFGLWFGDFHLFDNIATTLSFRGGVFSRWVLNTVLYAVVSAGGAMVLSTMAGYALAKYRFRGNTLVFNIILGAIMIPLTALALPTYILFSSVQLTDTVWAVILPSLVSPFGVYLMRIYAAESVDDNLIEAARIDGAGEFHILRRVALRLMGPGMVTVFLFQLVATWNNYFLPLIMLNSTDLYPLTVGLAQWQATSAGGSGSQALFSTVITGAMLSILPLIIAFLFLQRYWQSGLAAGGVKG